MQGDQNNSSISSVEKSAVVLVAFAMRSLSICAAIWCLGTEPCFYCLALKWASFSTLWCIAKSRRKRVSLMLKEKDAMPDQPTDGDTVAGENNPSEGLFSPQMQCKQ